MISSLVYYVIKTNRIYFAVMKAGGRIMKKVIILISVFFLVTFVFTKVHSQTEKDIRGFIYFSRIYGEFLEPIYPRALINLANAIKKYTKFDARLSRMLYLSDPRILDLPFLYLVTDKQFELTSSELENLKKYVKSGGFIVADNGNAIAEFGPAEASFRKMFKDILGNQARPVPISKTHELYKSFFQFDDGPPIGSEVGKLYFFFKRGFTSQPKYESEPVEYLEAFYLNDRMVGIYCDKGYGILWNRETENIPQLKMGINMVFYAISLPGSIFNKNKQRQ